ncbi:MAG: hypothetical protein JNM52_08675 [Betaproteobacteria bacterium]|nr:hypothetical protein [Betaproteobacteria bacterium]
MHVPERHKITSYKADGVGWRTLSDMALERRAIVFRHDFSVNDKNYFLRTAHAHGDFKTKITQEGSKYYLSKHNVVTSAIGKRAETLNALVGSFGSAKTGATNTMRILKGTHDKWQMGGTLAEATRGVELGAEIGVSEYTRGGTLGLLNAMSGLYAMKHGQMSKADFIDPAKGYVGAGLGGAKRLRTLAGTGKVTEALHLGKMKEVYDSHASTKVGKPWSGKSASEGFDIWVRHKIDKWTQREK